MKVRWVGMNMGRAVCALVIGVCLWMGGENAVLQAAANPYAVAGIENAAEFEKTFAELQVAVAANDRGKVTDLILYPLRVNGWMDETNGKSTVKFDTKPEVMDNYDEIFTTQVKAAIAKQKVAAMFVNWQGAMVGRGEAWLSVSGKEPRRYGIIAVNLTL
ncbi:MAG: hypothetical protein H6Q76_1218 [Firmicutes bacterium]|nr:hypothetical protein [Bacillota bacterium]